MPRPVSQSRQTLGDLCILQSSYSLLNRKGDIQLVNFWTVKYHGIICQGSSTNHYCQRSRKMGERKEGKINNKTAIRGQNLAVIAANWTAFFSRDHSQPCKRPAPTVSNSPPTNSIVVTLSRYKAAAFELYFSCIDQFAL